VSKLFELLNKLYRSLASRKLTLILFLLLLMIMIPGTLKERPDAYANWIYRTVFGALVVNMLLCTVQRFKSLSKAVIVMHIGVILIMAGTVVSTFGYISTVNIYEGTSVDKAYRWDIEQDIPLGFDLKVEKINIEYYPIPVRVGVKKGEEKVGLFELMTGETFELDGYTVRPDTIDLASKNLLLSVFSGDDRVGSADTMGNQELTSDFPYHFVFVAYQDPSYKRVWVDLELSKESQIEKEGITEVNSPLTWEKHRFYNTNIEFDPQGNWYAGIQITNDPGRPYVYFGFIIAGIGSVMYFVRKLYGYR
jgi:hypothetical protein